MIVLRKVILLFLLLKLLFGFDPVNAQDKFFHTSDGVRLHYIEAGEGGTLIFVPGWKVPADFWQYQIEHFSTQYRVIALDPRSQGRSGKALTGNYLERRARDIYELILHLDEKPLAVAGWSLGMWEVLSMLEQFGSDIVRGAVLVDNKLENQVTLQRVEGGMKAWRELQRDPKGFTDRFVRGVHAKTQPEDFIKKIIELSLEIPTSTAFAVGADAIMVERNWWPVLEQIEIPLLYVVRNRYKEVAEEMRDRIPGARVHVFGEAGHALFVDEPDRFNSVLSEFLDSIQNR